MKTLSLVAVLCAFFGCSAEVAGPTENPIGEKADNSACGDAGDGDAGDSDCVARTSPPLQCSTRQVTYDVFKQIGGIDSWNNYIFPSDAVSVELVGVTGTVDFQMPVSAEDGRYVRLRASDVYGNFRTEWFDSYDRGTSFAAYDVWNPLIYAASVGEGDASFTWEVTSCGAGPVPTNDFVSLHYTNYIAACLPGHNCSQGFDLNSNRQFRITGFLGYRTVSLTPEQYDYVTYLFTDPEVVNFLGEGYDPRCNFVGLVSETTQLTTGTTGALPRRQTGACKDAFPAYSRAVAALYEIAKQSGASDEAALTRSRKRILRCTRAGIKSKSSLEEETGQAHLGRFSL